MKDREIFDVAFAMFDRYGVAGAIIAAHRAAFLMQDESSEPESGANEWRRISRAVEVVSRRRPRDGETVH